MNVNFLKQENKELKAMLDIFGFKQRVEKLTRKSETTESLIEVILANNPLSLIEADVIPTGFGDHDKFARVRELSHARFKPREVICLDCRNYTPGAMIEELESVEWPAFYTCLNVNEAWSTMKISCSLFLRIMPSRFAKNKGHACSMVKQCVKENGRDKLLGQIRKTKAELDISKYQHKRNEVIIAIRNAKSYYGQIILP